MPDEDALALPPLDHPAYWDLIYVYAEIYADDHMDMDLDAVARTVRLAGVAFGERGLNDMCAMLLARIRLIDDSTLGNELIALSRKSMAIVRIGDENNVVDLMDAPHLVAAMDQTMPVLADALELDHCDPRSISAFLRHKMEGSPVDHHLALLNMTGSLLTGMRRAAMTDAQQDQ